MVQRPPTGTIPDAPGSYQFKDAEGRVIYVGKARSLRQRLNNYFQKHLPPRTASMVAAAETVEWIQVRNDVEALMLENTLIKSHQPRFNVRLRDDKSYPFLAVTLDDEWPRPMVMRGRKRKGVRYFGPYGHAYAIRETLDLLLRTFPLRTCSDNKFGQHERLGRPCLLFHIEQCSGPCIGAVSREDYDAHVAELLDFLDGQTDAVVERLEERMRGAADELEFEQAARLRDRLASVQKAIEKQQMVAERSEDFDVLGIADDELEAAVQVFVVRKGRVVGRKGFIVDKVEDLTPGELIGNVVERLYDDPPQGIPKAVLVPTEIDDPELYEEWLSSLRGSRVTVRVPQRGTKRELQATVSQNANEEFVRHRLRRASDHNSRARALNELQDHLGLPAAPLRIECYDMSHIQGSDYVGSMVVTEDGLPKKSEYRRFKIKGDQGNDDFAAMEQVLTRRLTAYLIERDRPIGDAPGKFSYPPQLLLVDGGKGQLAVAVRVLEDLGLAEQIPVAALAKKFEEVYLPGQADPVRIPRQSEALYLLQRIRDEAHRFAITYHRQLRAKRMTKSALDGIPGLGEKRQRRLTKELGGVAGVKRAGLDELRALTWLPDDVAQRVHDKLHAPTRRGMLRPGTGTS
jgi:excinuclease ABC subunit C